MSILNDFFTDQFTISTSSIADDEAVDTQSVSSTYLGAFEIVSDRNNLYRSNAFGKEYYLRTFSDTPIKVGNQIIYDSKTYNVSYVKPQIDRDNGELTHLECRVEVAQ